MGRRLLLVLASATRSDMVVTIQMRQLRITAWGLYLSPSPWPWALEVLSAAVVKLVTGDS